MFRQENDWYGLSGWYLGRPSKLKCVRILLCFGLLNLFKEKSKLMSG